MAQFYHSLSGRGSFYDSRGLIFFHLFILLSMRHLILIAMAFLIYGTATAQETRKIPSANIKGLDGKTFDTADFNNDGNPIVISFWATWCAPCKRELNNIAELYDDWQEDTGVKLIAISIDDSRSRSRVLPFVNGAAWDYEVYIDENQDFKRLMGVNNVPHTFLIDGEGNVVWQHNNYADGDEYELFEMITKHAN